MDELFAPPGNPWQPVSPKLATQRRVFLGLWMLVVLTVIPVVLVLLDAPTVLVGAVVVVGLLFLAWGMYAVGRNARAWGYSERDEELYIKSGVMFRRLVTVPYGRMQYVDVHAGPLDQMFDIANVHLHTASPGTSAVIPGLPSDEAARLRDRLTSLGEAQAAGL